MAKKEIFVIDDDVQMRKAITEALRRSGYGVNAFCKAEDALADMDHESCSLIITDVRMPGMSGLELLKAVRRSSPTLPVIIMTAYGTIQDAVDAMKLGASDYFLKPFSFEDVEQAVHKVFEQKPLPGAGRESEGGDQVDPGPKVFVTHDRRMKKILRFVQEISGSTATVLVQGESGTGKELIARMIHESSSVREGNFVAVNCAAIPEGLFESELFGHEKGAFSGAHARKVGKFESAHGGTVLLDEVGEMPLPLQAKLLRVLQEKEVDRVGGNRPVPVNVRIIATTNRDLRKEVRDGRFREDLFYRLNVVPIRIPSLHERPCDIIPISEYYLRKCAAREGKKILGLSREAAAFIKGRGFPGNVRELENLIERAALLCQAEQLEVSHLTAPDSGVGPQQGGEGLSRPEGSMRKMEQELILETLRKVGGNRTQASHLLGISLRTLRNKLADYKKAGVVVPGYQPGSTAGKKAALRCSDG
jgi:DNA-binding NtrC family response regulator